MRIRYVVQFVFLLVLCSGTSPSRLAVGENANRIGLPHEVLLNKGAGYGDALYLTLRLNEHEELLFEVETGASYTILDGSLAAKLGKALDPGTWNDGVVGKVITVGRYKTPDIYLGRTRLLMGDWVVTQDLSLVRRAGGHPVMGVLGMDCLAHYCIQLDFDAGKLRFLDPDNSEDRGLGKVFYLHTDREGRYAVNANLLDVDEVSSYIDTGNNSTGWLESKLFSRKVKDSNASVVVSHLATASGVSESREARFQKCVFGEESYQDFVYSVDEDGPAERAGVHARDVVLRINDRPANAIELWELRNLLQAANGKIR